MEEGGELSANDAPRQCHLPGANAGQGVGVQSRELPGLMGVKCARNRCPNKLN